jgi:BMFP domain-containing protein YqiC
VNREPLTLQDLAQAMLALIDKVEALSARVAALEAKDHDARQPGDSHFQWVH